MQTILVIDDEANMRHMLTALLGRSGYAVRPRPTAGEGLARWPGSPLRLHPLRPDACPDGRPGLSRRDAASRAGCHGDHDVRLRHHRHRPRRPCSRGPTTISPSRSSRRDRADPAQGRGARAAARRTTAQLRSRLDAMDGERAFGRHGRRAARAMQEVFRPGRQGGAACGHGAHHRRDRAPARSWWRSGIHALSRRAARAVRGRQLRRHPGEPAGERALRLRQGAFTGADRDKRRPGERGGRRHPLPRRDRRAAAGPAGEAAAGAAGGGGAAARCAAAAGRWTCACSPPPTATWRRRCAAAVPRGPVLPAQRGAHPPAAAARAAPRTSPCWPTSSSTAHGPPAGLAGAAPSPRRPWTCCCATTGRATCANWKT